MSGKGEAGKCGAPFGLAAGFTLVEVTLALGILSFSLFAILGLIPTGLSTMRQAMDSTIETQIIRQVGGEVLLTPYSCLGDIVGTPRYFDNEGQEQGAESSSTRFWVTLQRPNAVYPGSSNAVSLTNGLSAIQMVILRGPSPTSCRGTNFFNISIPNSGN